MKEIKDTGKWKDIPCLQIEEILLKCPCDPKWSIDLMASLTQWSWVWVNSGSWWWTGRPGMLRFMGLQRVGHDCATELNWTDIVIRIMGSQSQTWLSDWTELNWIPIKILVAFFIEMEKMILNFIWKQKRCWIAKTSWKRRTIRGTTLSDFKIYYKAIQ